jgi:hypothetical protein
MNLVINPTCPKALEASEIAMVDPSINCRCLMMKVTIMMKEKTKKKGRWREGQQIQLISLQLPNSPAQHAMGISKQRGL